MYGGGAGRNPHESEFFAPKMQQPEEKGKLTEIREMNTSLLDSLYSYGDGACKLALRLVHGLARLRKAVRAGILSPQAAQRAATFAVAAAAFCFAGVLRAAMLRNKQRQRQMLWDILFARAKMPVFYPFGPGLPRAAL